MRKVIFALLAVAFSISLNAQDFDIDAIAKARNNKADSLTAMIAKVNASQAAMNHPTAEARAILLKAFDEVINLDNQDEDFKEGNAIANEYFKIAQNMKSQSGIVMNRKEYFKAVMERFNDTTITIDPNQEVRNINNEARRMIGEITEMNKDSVVAVEKADLIAIMTDSLSRNMGQFFGMQMQAVSKQKNRSQEQIARLLEGFNNAINIDETNKPLVDGRMIGNDFMGIEQNIKNQLGLNLNKNIYINTVKEVLNDAAVPTLDDVNALNETTNAYFRETQAFARENSPEALAQKGLGKKYIDNLRANDPSFIETASGLLYKMINPGNGVKFGATDKIKVMYKGTHVDGKTFDDSKEPVTFAPNQVVPGFREALLMMSPGAKMIAVLPQNLAYGARGAGKDIKPFETLVFEIETIDLDRDEMTKMEGKASPSNMTKAPVKVVEQTKKPTGKKATAKKAATKKTSKRKK